MTNTQSKVPQLRFPEFSGVYASSTLEDITAKKISYGIVQAGPHVDEGMPYIKSKNLNSSINLESLERTSLEIAHKYRRSEVVPGDIVFSLRGAIGVSQIVPSDIKVANLTQGTARISVSKEHSNEFIRYALTTRLIASRIFAVSKGSTFKEISLEELRKLKVYHPGNIEEKKIASLLSTVDKKISLLNQKHNQLVQYKKGIMQQLFSQKLSFKDENGQGFPDWKSVQLKSILLLQNYPIDMQDDEEYELITAKRRNGGIVSRGKYLGKGVLVKSQFRLKENQFVISKRQIVHGACGLVPKHLEGAILSNEYNVFEGVPDVLDIHYFNLFSKTLEMKKAYFRSSDGVHIEKLLFRTKDWLKKRVKLPSLDEQKRIVSVSIELEKKISLIQQQIEQTQAYKQGLLQQMFV